MATKIKKAAFGALIKKVKALPVALVVGTVVQLYDQRGRQPISIDDLPDYGNMMQGLCPFHGDSRLGNFKVTPSRKRWRCFSCGVGGSGIDFECQHYGLEFNDAVLHMARRFDFITEEQYEANANKKADINVVNATIPEETADNIACCTRKADPDIIHAVYSAIPKVCKLEKKHRTHLIRERGLTEEELADYFTFPSASKDLAKAVFQEIGRKLAEKKFGKNLRELTKEEIAELDSCTPVKRLREQIQFVPGFYIDRKKYRIEFARRSGIGFLVRDHEGKAVGIQVRQDTVNRKPMDEKKREEYDKAWSEASTKYASNREMLELVNKAFDDKQSRYNWFSSSFAAQDQKKYDGGASSGCPGGVIFQDGDREKAPIVITEGRFKAVSIAKRGNIAIYVSGVSTWQNVMPMVEALKGNRKTVFVMFDADMMGNAAVNGQLKEMSKALQEMGLRADIIAWKIKHGKGIDDLIQKRREAYSGYMKVVRFDDFSKVYEIVKKRTVNKFGIKELRELQGLDKVWFGIDMQIAVEEALGLPDKPAEKQKASTAKAEEPAAVSNPEITAPKTTGQPKERTEEKKKIYFIQSPSMRQRARRA